MQHAAPFGNARPRPSSVCRLMPSTVAVLVSALGASLLLSTCREDHGPAALTELKVPTAREPCAAWVGPPSSSRRHLPLLAPQRTLSTAKLLDTNSRTVFTTGDNVGSPGDSATYAIATTRPGGAEGADLPRAGRRRVRGRRRAGYYGYFGGAAGDPTKGYYSYNLGAWHIVALNSATSMAAGSAQELWLKATWPPPPRNARSPTGICRRFTPARPPSLSGAAAVERPVRRARRRGA